LSLEEIKIKELPLTEAPRFLDIGGLISSSKHGLNILDNRTILEDKYWTDINL
jgi:hypothetical protein